MNGLDATAGILATLANSKADDSAMNSSGPAAGFRRVCGLWPDKCDYSDYIIYKRSSFTYSGASPKPCLFFDWKVIFRTPTTV